VPPREISYDTCLNFRDLGGYRTEDGRTVRFGRLYRSMTPEWMDEADLERARNELNLSVVVDLRGPTQSSGRIAAAPARQVHIDFMRGTREERHPRPETDDPAPFFQWWMRSVGPEIVESVEEIAEANGPTLFHCRTGKDRTGLVAAALLGLLGVSEEDIVADYMLSTPHFEPMIAFLRAREEAPPRSGFWPAHEPPSEAGIRAALDMVREEYGGMREFLRTFGARDDLLDEFIERLLEA
jgi:protein-tyrosine phosphatase